MYLRYVYVHVRMCRCPQNSEVWILLELELQMVLSCHSWHLDPLEQQPVLLPGESSSAIYYLVFLVPPTKVVHRLNKSIDFTLLPFYMKFY